MNCLVLGGAGFLGSHLCEELVQEGFTVRVLDLPQTTYKNLEHIKESIEILAGDFTNPLVLQNALFNIDVVVHLAWSTHPKTSNEEPVYDIESNLVGSVQLLNECVRNKVKKLVFISSGGTVYGFQEKIPIREDSPTNPLCSYGITKLAFEKYIKMYSSLFDFDCAIVRVSNLYGERQNLSRPQGCIGVFLDNIITGQPITIWGDGSIVRDYLYVKDAAKAFAAVCAKSHKSKVFNVGSGVGMSVNEIVEITQRVSNRRTDVIFQESRSFDIPVNVLDITRARKELLWKPETCIEEGVKKTCDWMVQEALSSESC